jgi:hypothetical protein
MSYSGIISIDGNPANGTIAVSGGDTLQTLTELGIPVALGNGERCVSVFVSVESNPARFGFGGGAAGHVIATGGSVVVRGGAAINALRLSNATGGSTATIQITPYY